MSRSMTLSLCVLAWTFALEARATEPPEKSTAEQREEWFAKGAEQVSSGDNSDRADKNLRATKALQEALALARQLYPDGHPTLATLLTNLAGLYYGQGKLSAAEVLYKEALEMRRRLFKGDHPYLAQSLDNLALLYRDQGKFAEAEPLHKQALGMRQRLFKGDHTDVATSLNNLGFLYRAQGKLAEAGPLYEAALRMRQRLFKGDHPLVAHSLNNLGFLFRARGKPAEAEPFAKAALEMYKRLYRGDHPLVALALNNLAILYRAGGKLAAAASLHKAALEMFKRLTTRYATQKSEGEALNLAGSQPLTRDRYLSVARARAADPASTYDPAAVYPAVWASKGAVARVFEQRHLRARAATDPALAGMLADLADARRRRAELLLARATEDPATLKQRAADLTGYEGTIARLDRELARRLPAVARIDRLDAATSADLQKALPAGTALVDYVRYWFFEWDNRRPPGEQEKYTARYLAFAVTRNRVAWIDLGTADNVEAAVSAWRGAITGGKAIPPRVPGKVRALVWEPIRKHLPEEIRTVYVCPDGALCRVPFAALPGEKEGTVLLEEYALACVPHAPFLLDHLWPPDPHKAPPASALVVGAVHYDAKAKRAVKGAGLRGPVVKPGAELVWGTLPHTANEAGAVAKAAARRKLPVIHLGGDKATPSAVLRELPRAKVAHFATHGFFADPSFRGLFNLDEKDYQKSLLGERIGRAVNSPLVMTGLVFAGANRPGVPGRGIVTGESLVDLDLGGLELAVLSACDTGLGDVAGGEGVFGLQRAFHYAGTRNVVASLWKVPDEPTAALMGRFYHHLWEKDLPPIEALRQAQLDLYHNPKEIAAYALGFRGTFKVRPGAKDEAPETVDGQAHPLVWAAFSLSGTGR